MAHRSCSRCPRATSSSARPTGCRMRPPAGWAFRSPKSITDGRRRDVDNPEIGRNISMELARCTEAAALMAGRWMGRGDKEASDQAAVDAMRRVLNTVQMDGIVVIGEGEKDQAPMLFTGERLGCASDPKVDIAV